MASEFWARLEDPSGRVVGPDPAWRPQRQFLWDVVHDTRGVARGEAFQPHLDLIRTIDSAQSPTPRAALDPAAVRQAYERLVKAAESHDAKFRLVAPAGSDDWAAVNFFEDEGTEYALVGGWTGPVLRVISPEPDLRAVPVGDVTVGSRQFRVREVPYAEYFREDFDSLFAVLRDAESRGLKIRFLQR